MMTIFTSFKPFTGEANIQQRNALQSWRSLAQDAEIIVFGLAPGIEPIVDEFRIRYFPEIEGVLPRVDLMFAYAQAQGRFDIQAYVNGDIILFEDFICALNSIGMSKFLMIGQRIDVDVEGLLDFGETARARTKQMLAARGKRHDVGGIDYFAYRRGSIPVLPPLYVGAAGWDNITVYYCRRSGIPVVDATSDVDAYHQNHTYQLLPDGKRIAYEGPAAIANKNQVFDRMCFFYTIDATHWLHRGRLYPALVSSRYLWRFIQTYPVVRGWCKASHLPFRLVAALVRRVGLLWCWLSKRWLGRVLGRSLVVGQRTRGLDFLVWGFPSMWGRGGRDGRIGCTSVRKRML